MLGDLQARDAWRPSSPLSLWRSKPARRRQSRSSPPGSSRTTSGGRALVRWEFSLRQLANNRDDLDTSRRTGAMRRKPELMAEGTQQPELAGATVWPLRPRPKPPRGHPTALRPTTPTPMLWWGPHEDRQCRFADASPTGVQISLDEARAAPECDARARSNRSALRSDAMMADGVRPKWSMARPSPTNGARKQQFGR